MSEKPRVAASIAIAAAIAMMPPSAVRHLARQGRPKDNPPEVDNAIDAVIAKAVIDGRIAKAEAKRKRKAAKRLRAAAPTPRPAHEEG